MIVMISLAATRVTAQGLGGSAGGVLGSRREHLLVAEAGGHGFELRQCRAGANSQPATPLS